MTMIDRMGGHIINIINIVIIASKKIGILYECAVDVSFFLSLLLTLIPNRSQPNVQWLSDIHIITTSSLTHSYH